jgi:hypothetical protein
MVLNLRYHNEKIEGLRVCTLYLYEPDQQREASVHSSHIAFVFVFMGLLDFDRRTNASGAGPPARPVKPVALGAPTVVRFYSLEKYAQSHSDYFIKPNFS